MKIGFVGIGVMGSRMVRQFLKAGYDVSVYSRTPKKADPLVELGAIEVDSIRTLASFCDVICTCLSMPEDVEEVYQHVFPYAKAGTICVDFTTVGKKTSNDMYEKAKERSLHYLDAPVSGGPEGVEQGTLTIMVGGDRPAYETVLPLLRTIGATIEYLGPSGSGSIAKLMNQYLVAVHTLAAAEAMVVGRAYGLKAEQLFRLLKESYGDSRMLRRHMEQYVLDRQFEPGGAMKYLHKDIKLANELTANLGFRSFSGLIAERALKEAIDDGLADKDMSALILPLEKKCQVTVKREDEKE